MTKAWFNEEGARRVAIVSGADVSGSESRVVITDPTTGNTVLFTTGSGNHAIVKAPTGGYYTQEVNPTARTTTAGGVNRIEFIPFSPDVNITVDQLSVNVTTLAAATNCRISIWNSGAGNLPNVPILGGATSHDCSTTGEKTEAVSGTLQRGNMYFLCIFHNGAPTFTAAAVASHLQFGAPAPGITTAGFTSIRGTASYASGLPTSYAGVTSPTFTANAATPIIWVRQGA